MNSYLRFALMIATSTLIMFGLMYATVYRWEHVWFSETRLWMALMMGAVMAMVMLSFMLPMYGRRGLNLAIYLGSAGLLALSLWLLRSQATIDEEDWMRAMIPHHSIAILTSERADLQDPQAQELARHIIDTQRREIAEMEAFLRQRERNRDNR